MSTEELAGAPAPDPSEAASKKLAAGICGILLGGLGIHKFILGFNTPGIIYLTKSDEEFYQTYMVGRKEWF